MPHDRVQLAVAYGSSQHTLMVTWQTRIILVVSYIGPYLGWVPPEVSHLLPNYPPDTSVHTPARGVS